MALISDKFKNSVDVILQDSIARKRAIEEAAKKFDRVEDEKTNILQEVKLYDPDKTRPKAVRNNFHSTEQDAWHAGHLHGREGIYKSDKELEKRWGGHIKHFYNGWNAGVAHKDKYNENYSMLDKEEQEKVMGLDEDGRGGDQKRDYGTIKLGGKIHPKNRVPIEHYDEFRQKNPSSFVAFRGPRKGTAHTRKEDATHFYIREDMDVEFAELGIDPSLLEAIKHSTPETRAKLQDLLDKKREEDEDELDHYNFSKFVSAEDKRKAAGGVKVSGHYGKAKIDDEEGSDEGDKKTIAAPAPIKRGRGRPRKNPL